MPQGIHNTQTGGRKVACPVFVSQHSMAQHFPDGRTMPGRQLRTASLQPPGDAGPLPLLAWAQRSACRSGASVRFPGTSIPFCAGPVLQSCSGPVLQSCAGPVLQSCFGPVLQSWFGPVLLFCSGPVLQSWFGPVLLFCSGPGAEVA